MRPPASPFVSRAFTAALLCLSLAATACGGDDDGDGDADDDGTAPDGGRDGIAIEGLTGPVDVYFDEHGILHASCQTDADCYAVEGYYHAAHRFGQMDIRRRLARGKLAALVPLALSVDKEQRRMMTARDGTPLEERLLALADDATRAALEAYSKGVNAWLDDLANQRNGAALPDEYDYAMVNQASIMDDWEPLDSVACILPLLSDLTENSASEIAFGDVYGSLDPDTAEDLFSMAPASTNTVLPPPIKPAGAKARAGAAAIRARKQRHARMAGARSLFAQALRGTPNVSLERDGLGSNNWVVGPSRTTGGTLMANDPHLQMSHPAVWYLVHLDAKTNGDGSLHIAGASFAGLPGIVLGQNENIAWGATTTFFDATDVYIETLSEDRTAVLFQGKEVPIKQVEYTFEVGGGAPVTESFAFVPHHGPIVTPIDETSTTALSVRWTGHDADTDINFFLALASATSVEEARVALENVTTAGQNFVVIDREHIGWFPYNRLPSRPWMSAENPPWLPLKGTGEFEWGTPIPYDKLPQAVDPADGVLATSNNDMTGALADGDPTNDGHAFLQSVVDDGYRQQRILQRLNDVEEHDVESMRSIQADVHSLLGELLTPPILASVQRDQLDADGQAVFDALGGWTDFECTTGLVGTAPTDAIDPETATSARGCAAFHVAWGRLRDLIFTDDIKAENPGLNRRALPSALIRALTDPEALTREYWDDVTTADRVETQADIVAAALDQAGAALRKAFGGAGPAEWVWGRMHTLTLRADLFDVVTQEYNSSAFANDGGRSTVDVAAPRTETAADAKQAHGPSMRYVCRNDEDGVQCTIELPGGQRHDRSSGFYNSLLDGWLNNRPAPFLFSIADAAAAAVETVQVAPL